MISNRKSGTLALALAILLVTLLANGQEQKVGALSASAGEPKAEIAGSDNRGTGQPQLQRRNQRYKIQHSDVLSIAFPLSPEFDQPKVTVQPDGYINLHGAGSLYIQEMTVPEAVEALKKAYAGVLHEPIINLDLIDFQKPYFLISGQVGKPGQYELRHDTTLSQGIAMAGGFSPTAKTQVFLYHRVSNDWIEVKKFNVKDILHGKNVNEDAILASGDSIFVPEKFITSFRKYIPYGIGTGFGFY